MSITNPLGVFRNFRQPGGLINRQARITQTFRPNSLCFSRIGSEHAEIPLSATPRTDLIVLGCFEGLGTFTSSSTTDGVDTAAAIDAVTLRPQMVQIRPGIADNFATGTSSHQILAKHVDQPCFAFDDNTLYIDDLGGTLPFAGFVDAVAKDGTVSVRMGEDQRVLYELFMAGGFNPSATSDDSVSYVITNLPAGAFAAGVWTATATGAISTTQDGLTVAPAVGDKVLFPPGTLTTQVVTAAQSGPYECVVAGATGVKAVYARTAKFAHGAIITPGTRVKVTLGGATTFSGTVWRCDPTAANKVVDTDDPVMFPERVVIPMTCASGTATTALCPLRATGKFAVLVDFTGGSPAATTTNIVASTQTPGAIGTASIVIQEQAHLGTLVNTGSATANVLIVQ